MGFIEIIKAIIFGVIEGITEWLPVSSTGHLILLDEFLSLNVAPSLDATFADEYMSMFEVVIQLGAILAVVVMFFGKLNPFAPSKSAAEKKATWVLWFKVLIASYKPCAVVLNVTTNDMAYYNLSEKQILGNMITLYELTRELLPETYVFFVSGNPLPGRTEYTDTIIRTNNAMAHFCEKNEMCEFIDVYARVLAIAEKYPSGWDTWTHMNQANLKIMFDDIKSAILAWKTNEGITF